MTKLINAFGMFSKHTKNDVVTMCIIPDTPNIFITHHTYLHNSYSCTNDAALFLKQNTEGKNFCFPLTGTQ